ncbi:MAG: hypothetical protein U1A78_06790 [Polyangia bacterium]
MPTSPRSLRRPRASRAPSLRLQSGLRPLALGLLGLSTAGLPGCGDEQPMMRMPPDVMTEHEAPLDGCSAAMLKPAVAASGGVDGAADPGRTAAACISPAPDDAPGSAIDLQPGSALQLAEYTVLGPAVTLRLGQPLGRRGVDLRLPFDISKLPDGGKGERQRLVVLSRFGSAPVHVTPVENITISAAQGGQLRFHLPGHGLRPRAPAGTLGEVGTFQVAMPADLGQKLRRRFVYRAVGGISMGGIGASMYFFRHPERFDAVGVMGADPGPDLTYTQGFIRDFFFGGFCTAEDMQLDPTNPDKQIGKACPPRRGPLAGQAELTGTFEAMPIQTGEGIGLTLRRRLFLRANRDLVRALGNWAYYNPKDPYLPPGVPASTLEQAPAVACASPIVIKGLRSDPMARPFYDGRYNPAGQSDVITFCDGGEPDGRPGVFDPSQPQLDPAQILLAVDLNGNRNRDAGEPVLMQQSEPFRDVGLDGLPDAREPGYDPIKNPDPAGDNYHYLTNPGGTEGNWRYDAGEPYDDVGLDGVADKGCDIVSGPPGCFDYGEKNGRFDLNPGLQKWLEHDPHTLIEKIPLADLAQRDIFYDAGIRDFFNAHVSTSALFGALSARGLSLQLYGGFPALVGLGPTEETRFDANSVDLAKLGRRAFVRYGNPEIAESEAEKTGDGRHAGAVTQVIHRAIMLFSYLLSRWPDADTSLQADDDPRLVPKNPVFETASGRRAPYSLILPPGYFLPQNAQLRYPIIYIGHGYGMEPEDLGRQIGSLIHSYMSDPDPKRRLPKAVLVFLDGKCRPGGDVPSGPLPAMGDQCEEGTFYTDHPLGGYKGEALLEELDAYLRKTYRLREPAEVEVTR